MTSHHPLELRNLSKRFGAITAVEGFDLTIEAGEIVALVVHPG